MKVLLNDGLNKEGIKIFNEAGFATDTKKRDAETLVRQIGEFDALIVRSATRVTREVIEAGAKGHLKIVGRAGVGYDNIDTVAASQNGIIVKNAPWSNINATAVFTIPENAHPLTYLRIALGAIFVLFLPGYALIKTLFPSKVPFPTSSENMDNIERTALSIGMSLALTPIVGLILNYTPWGIRSTPVTLSLLALTVTFATAAILREYQTKTK